MYFYTITDEDGTAYKAVAPCYFWRDVCEFFGVRREQLSRGANWRLPAWEDRKHQEAA